MIVRKQNGSPAQGTSEVERMHGLWPCPRPSRLAAARAAETFFRAVDSGRSGNSLGRSPGIVDSATSSVTGRYGDRTAMTAANLDARATVYFFGYPTDCASTIC
jgi:hypothetical protein